MNIKAGSCALRTVHTIVILVATLFSAATPAVVNVDITRVIINAGEKSVPLSLDNSGDQPMLVQVWVDEGNPGVSPDKVKTPVVILPPVFRMSPGEERSVKILLANPTLLHPDREALYWLNIYQVPPLPVQNEKASLQDDKATSRVILPLRIRMKLFIRPEGVAPPSEKEGEKLIFARQMQGTLAQLSVRNPTPWHMTLATLSCGKTMVTGVLIAPGTRLILPFKGHIPECATVNYEVINDDGNRLKHVAQVQGR